MKEIKDGCYTALVTPFQEDGIDWEAFKKLIEFQCKAGVTGVLVAGTTGETPTLSKQEHLQLILRAKAFLIDKNCALIAGLGANSTQKAIEYTKQVKEIIDAGLYVDPYYNKPTSFQIRKFYYQPIAQRFPELLIIPYVIPGRTGGTGLLPEDLAKLVKTYPNVVAIKDASGSDERAIKTRSLLPEPFKIFSGDDGRTFRMMIHPEIRANGVISVISNFLPGTVQKFTDLLKERKIKEAKVFQAYLKSLFDLVTVKDSTGSWPNPCSVKTILSALGMIKPILRPPLSLMSSEAVKIVREKLRDIILILEEKVSFSDDLELLRKEIQKDIDRIENIFDVHVIERIKNPEIWKTLCL